MFYRRQVRRKMQHEMLEPRLALDASMLLDINTAQIPTGSYPRDFTQIGDDVYFVTTNESGDEVWKTDGTNVELIADFGRDFNPADFGGSHPVNRQVSRVESANTGAVIAFTQDPDIRRDYENFAETSDDLYFVDFNTGELHHSSPFRETESWRFNFINPSNALVRIDTTETTLIPQTDIDLDKPASFGVLGDIVLVSSGKDVWRTDGTAEGTFALSTTGPTALKAPTEFRKVGDKMFYITSPENAELELWLTDGSVEGTKLVSTLFQNPLSLDLFPPSIVSTASFNGSYHVSLFTNPITHWSSDGTNTVMETQQTYSQPDGELVAQLNDRLVYWDSENLSLVGTDFDGQNPHFENLDQHACPEFAADNVRIYFLDSFSFWDDSIELWSYAGVQNSLRLNGRVSVSTENTELIDECPTTDLATLSTRLVFANQTESDGRELWVSDGTPEGTVQLADIAQSDASSNPANFFSFQNRVFFTAETETSGRELWVTDGTESGTKLVYDINRGPGDSDIGEFTVFGDRLWFSAYTDGTGSELWSTDGTQDGTFQLELAPGIASSTPNNLTAIGNWLYFSSEAGNTGFEPWVTDGSIEGTRLLHNVEPERNDHSQPRELTVLGDWVVFSAEDAAHGNELWISDGTTAGTRLLKDIAPGPASSDISEITVWRDHAYFTATDEIHGRELWRTDGTTSGTQMVTDIYPGAGGSAPYGMHATSNALFFTAYDNDLDDDALWATDGTSAGTARIYHDTDWSLYNPIVELGEKTYFAGAVTQLLPQRELWITDGTPGGTELVEIMEDPSCGEAFDTITSVGTKLLFTFSGDRFRDSCRLMVLDTVDNSQEFISYEFPQKPFLDANFVAPVAETNDSIVFLMEPRSQQGSSKPTTFVEYFVETGELIPFGGEEPHDLNLIERNLSENNWNIETTDESIFFPFPSSSITVISRNSSQAQLIQDAMGDLAGIVSQLSTIDDRLFFVATSKENGIELWQSDGTSIGTRTITDISPGNGDSFPSSFVQLGDRLVFRADDGFHGSELWTVDLPQKQPFQFSSSFVTIREDGTSDDEITVRRSGSIDKAQTFMVEYLSDSATGFGDIGLPENADFVASPLTFTFQPFQSEVAIPLPVILQDSIAEQIEYFSMRIVTENENATSLSSVTTVEIVDDDILGDLNGDGTLTVDDLDKLVADVALQAEESPAYDLNFDGTLDSRDIAHWLEIAGPVLHPQQRAFQFGDANLDGIVDASDWQLSFSCYETATAAWSELRDFNADGVNDGSDFNIWNENRFRDQPVPARLPRIPQAALARTPAADVESDIANTAKTTATERSRVARRHSPTFLRRSSLAGIPSATNQELLALVDDAFSSADWAGSLP